MTDTATWAMIVGLSIVPAFLAAAGKDRFWPVAFGVFITFASGWFALLFGALDLPAHTAKPWILLATGAAGMTVGGRIVQANWKNRRH